MEPIDSNAPVPPPPPRRHRSRAERRELIAAWRSSGLSKVAFARERGINAKSLGRWIREEPSQGGPGFVPVVSASTEMAPVRWILPQGLGSIVAEEGLMTRLLLAVLREAHR